MLRWCALARLARLRSAAGLAPSLRQLSADAAPSQQQDALGAVLRAQLDDIRAAGTYKVERVITSPQSASVGEGRPGVTWVHLGCPGVPLLSVRRAPDAHRCCCSIPQACRAPSTRCSTSVSGWG
jgi:hypothetical protein